MPHDPTGTAHTGTRGLFDDPDEQATSSALATSHSKHRLKGQIRRLERQDQACMHKQQRREEKQALRVAQGKAAEGWFGRIFGGGQSRGKDTCGEEGSRDGEEEGGQGQKKKNTGVVVEYKILPRPTTPEAEWKVEDVQVVDSVWLQECGMVRVKSGNPGGCHIVSGSVIGKGV